MSKLIKIFSSLFLALVFTTTSFSRISAKQNTAQVKVCEERQETVTKRMQGLVDLATKTFKVFDRHAQRVQTYYTEKVIPSGKTIENYDALVADIAAKKVSSEKALNEANAVAAGFTCDDRPAVSVTNFRTKMQATKKALQEYRVSVKNLIVAVRSVNQ